jgi:hypothetical protein
MSADELAEPDPRVLQLSGDALRAAMREDWDAAGDAIQAINGEHGFQGLVQAICTWCDAVALNHPAARAIESRPGAVTQLAWSGDDIAGIETADEVDPHVRWAGQVTMARVMMDHEAFRALLLAIPGDEAGDYIGVLLQSVALTLLRIGDGSVARRTAEAVQKIRDQRRAGGTP